MTPRTRSRDRPISEAKTCSDDGRVVDLVTRETCLERERGFSFILRKMSEKRNFFLNFLSLNDLFLLVLRESLLVVVLEHDGNV